MYGIFLDIETTGLNAAVHVPIDIACKVIDLTSGFLLGEYQSIIKHPWEVWENKDPASIEVNGFGWEEISGGKSIAIVSGEVIALFGALQIRRGEAVFICQNPAFDRGFFNQIVGVYEQERLNWPYHWLDLASMYWAGLVRKALQEGVLVPQRVALSKNDIARTFHLEPELVPHRAMKGVEHLILCYQAVLGVKFQ